MEKKIFLARLVLIGKVFSINEGGYNIYFIDTPGLNKANVDEDIKKMLKNELSPKKDNKYKINCILIIMKVMDYGLTNGIQQMIIELMNWFPFPNFWDHILIIRTHCFNQSLINNIKGNFENIIKNDEIIKNKMQEKRIRFPKHIIF